MSKEKIILSAAALLITAAGAFSFKSAPKHFGGGEQLIGSYKNSSGVTVCVKVTCWKTTNGGTIGPCHTTVKKLQVVRSTYTARTINGVNCKNRYVGLKTHTN